MYFPTNGNLLFFGYGTPIFKLTNTLQNKIYSHIH